MEYAGGTGLAAPQVHVPLRVVLFYVEATRAARENDPKGSMARPMALLAMTAGARCCSPF